MRSILDKFINNKNNVNRNPTVILCINCTEMADKQQIILKELSHTQ